MVGQCVAAYVNDTFGCSVIFIMEKLIEQKVCLKFCFKPNFNCQKCQNVAVSFMLKTKIYESI